MRKDASAAGTYSSPACYLHEFEPARGRAGRRDIRIKRIYDAAKPSDGFRALVDRLWPRGISKRHAALDEWTESPSITDGPRCQPCALRRVLTVR
jgi:hypothetical protein